PDWATAYVGEECPHRAVAAPRAAGRADAGGGVRAAAARFGLAFVPLGRERYWLALRRQAVSERRTARFLAAFRGPALPRIARHLAGYDAAGAGEVASLSALEAQA